MRYLIIGAVAAGTSAATEIRRRDKTAEITIYEKGAYISYAGCGMPYYISGEAADISELVPRDPAFFKAKHGIDILTEHEVVSIQSEMKSITVKNHRSGNVFQDFYDALILATGASSVIPPLKGAEKAHVFKLRTIEDTLDIRAFITQNRPKKAAIIGTGLVGLEMCESFVRLGIQTTLIARATVSKGLDADMTAYIEKHLADNGVTVLSNTPTTEITDQGVLLSGGQSVEADIVLLATGIRPNVGLAREAGIELGATGAVKVDNRMRTSVKDIYSCGDCAEVTHLLTGKPVYRPLGSTANKTGVIAGNNAAGGSEIFPGVLGTGIFRVFDMTAAQTGLSEKEAADSGYEPIVSLDTRPDKPAYMGGKNMVIKSVADKSTGRLLGAQIVGYDGVDKRIDILAALITTGATAETLTRLDLAYAPPYSTPRDPLYYTGIKLGAQQQK